MRGLAGLAVLAALSSALPADLPAYPLDGDAYTGIARLRGYRLAQEGQARGPRVPPGARLHLAQVDLRLRERPGLAPPAPDPRLSAQLRSLLGEAADRYALALLDLSDPQRPRYAEHRATRRFNPGSVGKLAIALALFQGLADAFPEREARERVLRETRVVADDFIHRDHHTVPFWDPERRRVWRRPVRLGDAASLWTYLDWMLSASSNAAASIVLQQAVLLDAYGRDFPPPEAAAQQLLADTPRKDLSRRLAHVLQDPIRRNGLDLEGFRQGGFFTREAKRRIPGTSSHATPRELLRLLLRLEQGRLVDAFSSREIKRLLYMTERRIRYASSPALREAAVYFKSGSLYRCRPEPDFRCLKYHGNVENWMNSVAIVESPAGRPRLHYLVVVMSNVLRENSAVAHQTLATRIHRLLERYHAGRANGQ